MNRAAAIVSNKQLGDVLLLQPSAAHLAAQNGQPTALFVREAFRPLVSLMPGCTWGPEAGSTFTSVWTTSWSSRAVWWAFKLRTRQRFLIVNKPRHVRWWYRFIFHGIRLEPPTAEYWARYFWRITSDLPPEEFPAPVLAAPPPSWRHPDTPEPGYLLVNPTAAWSTKFWSARHWGETIAQLASQGAPPIVLAGGASDREKAHCREISQSAGIPLLDLAGKTTMQQYLHLLAGAGMVLCIDGAASHLAQAFGVPTVTIFGPTHPGKWHWPTPRHRVLSARDYPPVKGWEKGSPLPAAGVPVSAVLGEAQSLLFGGGL